MVQLQRAIIAANTSKRWWLAAKRSKPMALHAAAQMANGGLCSKLVFVI
jgi:hypothetical protein